MSGNPIRVEVWSDVVCPWCYIGKRRIERALAALRDDPSFTDTIALVYRPFQLDPNARRGVTEPVADAYARKFGGPEQAAAIMARVTAAAAEDGIEFHLERAQRANTADAHRLLWWTLWADGPATQAALKESLMQAYFVDGENIADYDVLVDRAARCGLDSDAAREVLETEDGIEALAVGLRRAAEHGITAVPTYVIDDQWSIPGAQDAAVFEQVFRRLAARRTEPASA
jgi:predicted DsbA family dithiol-disulfide isomerase